MEALLRDHGLRVTQPRLLVLQALLDQPDHPTADDLAILVEPFGVHRATVYRTLETLVDAHVVSHVHLDNGVTAYHLVGVVDRPDGHLHARCHDCGAVVDLPPDLLDGVAQSIDELVGFELAAGHIALSGRCQRCRARG